MHFTSPNTYIQEKIGVLYIYVALEVEMYASPGIVIRELDLKFLYSCV